MQMTQGIEGEPGGRRRLGSLLGARERGAELLAEAGVKRLAVLSPAFVADCLETLEELGMRAAEQWQELSGGELRLVPSLNAHPLWVRAVASMIRRAGQDA